MAPRADLCHNRDAVWDWFSRIAVEWQSIDSVDWHSYRWGSRAPRLLRENPSVLLTLGVGTGAELVLPIGFYIACQEL